jgi:hypothetical protein
MHRLVLALLLAAATLCLAVSLGLLSQARAHDWYSKYKDPEHRTNCCGGHDCAPWRIRTGSVSPENGGWRVRLTLEEARQINPLATAPIDTWVSAARVMQSENGGWDICLRPSWRDGPDFGVICLFGPPST